MTGLVVARLQGERLPLPGRERLAIALGAFVGGMIGAKLPYVFADWAKLASGEAWLEGGKTITTGLVGGYFGVELAKKAAGITVKTGDAICVPVAAALAVGRLACLVGGCCYGVATTLPWAMDFGDGVRRHPTQLYEFVVPRDVRRRAQPPAPSRAVPAQSRQALPRRVPGLPIPDGVHPSGAARPARVDALPGRGGRLRPGLPRARVARQAGRAREPSVREEPEAQRHRRLAAHRPAGASR